MDRLDTLVSHLEEDLFVRVERRGCVGVLLMRHRAPLPASEAALTIEMRRSLLRGLRRLQTDSAVRVVVLTSDSPRVFSSGVNRESFGDALVANAERQIPSLAVLCDAVESSEKPVVAYVQGSCASWGLELAMAASVRIAFANARFRFPEVELSLVPCGGGTARLTHLVGTRMALQMLCTGRTLTAKGACAAGLVDTVLAGTGVIAGRAPAPTVTAASEAAAEQPVASPSLFLRVVALAEAFAAEAATTCRPSSRARGSWSTGLAPASAVHLAWMRHKLRERAPADTRAPYLALRAVALAVNHAADRDGALAAERRLFVECLAQPECAAMQHVLRASMRTLGTWDRTLRAELSVRQQTLPFQYAAVIGAGAVGTSLAFLLLQHGLRVALVEVDDDRRAAAQQRLEAEIMAAATAHKRLSVAEARDAVVRLTVCGSHYAPLPSVLREVDLVIDCTPEAPLTKANLFTHLDRMCAGECVLASCAASVGVGALAAVTRRPARVVGLRFYPPANVNPLVELSTLPGTDSGVLRRVMALMGRLQKHVVVTRDCVGHLGTRVLLAGLYQAYTMVEEGCFPYDVDRALREHFHFRTGLLELEDLMGLDAMGLARQQLALGVASAGASDPLGSPLMPRDVYAMVDGLVRDGLVGRKRGEGWHRYRATARPSPEHDPDPEGKDEVLLELPSLTAAWNPLTWRSGAVLPPGQWQTLLAIRDVAPLRSRAVELRALRVSKAKATMRRDFEAREIYERVILVMINEAAKLLAAGVAACAADVDCLSVHAYGFPAWKGGLLFYADRKLGVDGVIRRMEVYRNSVGADAFPSPCEALMQMSRRHLTFARAYPEARADAV